MAGAPAVEDRRWAHHRRARSRRDRQARTRCDARRGSAAIGLCLSLRLRDAGWRRGLHHLVSLLQGNIVMAGLPILSIIAFLPLAGAGLILALRSGDAAARLIALVV